MLYFFVVGLSILLEEVVGFSLSRRFRIGIVEQILDSKENLLDGDRWFPSLLLVQDG